MYSKSGNGEFKFAQTYIIYKFKIIKKSFFRIKEKKNTSGNIRTELRYRKENNHEKSHKHM